MAKEEIMSESVWYIYPGQPFIGEAIIYLLMAFNNEPGDDGTPSLSEGEHSQIAYALIMIALESLIKAKLDEEDAVEPRTVEGLLEQTIKDVKMKDEVIKFWNELKITRNSIIPEFCT